MNPRRVQTRGVSHGHTHTPLRHRSHAHTQPGLSRSNCCSSRKPGQTLAVTRKHDEQILPSQAPSFPSLRNLSHPSSVRVSPHHASGRPPCQKPPPWRIRQVSNVPERVIGGRASRHDCARTRTVWTLTVTAIRTRTPESRLVAPRPCSSHFHPRSGRYCDGDGDVPRRAVSNPERRVSICMRTVTQYPIPHPVIILSHKSPRSSVALAHTSRVLAPDRGRPTSFDKYRRSHVHPARRTSSHGASLVHFSTAPRLSLSGNEQTPSPIGGHTVRITRIRISLWRSHCPHHDSGDARACVASRESRPLRLGPQCTVGRWDPRMPPRIRSAEQDPSGEFYPARSSGLSLYEHARPPSHCTRRTTHAHHLIALFAGVTTGLGPRHAQFSVVDVRRGSLSIRTGDS